MQFRTSFDMITSMLRGGKINTTNEANIRIIHLIVAVTNLDGPCRQRLDESRPDCGGRDIASSWPICKGFSLLKREVQHRIYHETNKQGLEFLAALASHECEKYLQNISFGTAAYGRSNLAASFKNVQKRHTIEKSFVDG
jgi:hypothetical protein